MDFSDPLPLIERPETIPDVGGPQHRWSLRTCGYLLIAMTWLLFVVTVNLFFAVWRVVLEPWRRPETMHRYERAARVCRYVDTLVLSGWCLYVMMWWWLLVSWCSLKLFRHSKGLQA